MCRLTSSDTLNRTVFDVQKATFEPTAGSAGAARRLVRGWLAAGGVTADLDVVLLVVSELATNAIVHAGTVFEVWVDLTGPCVRVGVDDLDDAIPHPVEPELGATSGRGLAMVRAVAARWGSEYTQHGKSTWAEICGE